MSPQRRRSSRIQAAQHHRMMTRSKSQQHQLPKSTHPMPSRHRTRSSRSRPRARPDDMQDDPEEEQTELQPRAVPSRGQEAYWRLIPRTPWFPRREQLAWLREKQLACGSPDPMDIKPEETPPPDAGGIRAVPEYMPGPSHHQATPPQYPRASLLGLPGELRNTIMRLALLEDDLILIDRSNSAQPGVLRACRQLRKEGRGIFEAENSFYVEAWDLKLRIPPNSEKHWILGLNYKISLKGAKNWPNLKRWLEEYYECNFRGLADGQPTQWSQTVALAFRMVDDLRKKVRAFREIEPVLESWMLTLELAGTDFEHTVENAEDE